MANSEAASGSGAATILTGLGCPAAAGSLMTAGAALPAVLAITSSSLMQSVKSASVRGWSASVGAVTGLALIAGAVETGRGAESCVAAAVLLLLMGAGAAGVTGAVGTLGALCGAVVEGHGWREF